MKLNKELTEKIIYWIIRGLLFVVGVLILSYGGDRYDGVLSRAEIFGVASIVLSILAGYLVALIYKLLGK